MKLSKLVLASTLTGLMSCGAATAAPHEKAPAEQATPSKMQVTRADFLGLKDQYLVKTDKGVQPAKSLKKGNELVTDAGEPFAVLTGKLVVKLAEGVSADEFAKSMDLRLDWQSSNQLVLLSAAADADLLGLLERLKANPQVLRAKLDRAANKQEPM
ncbi:hypothetical protein JYB88_11505 [Shewanella cyperi]|uniref:ASP external chaperone domain-containing protein n=1 Tax=Shewanella cyperi TaxID=2814292 RepID=A0A974XQY1_9GAMM|nr:hypothetical protein [Shewanella cyperi]QSX28884.1 hypothetical protein JYB88_11505 [Shewanella cyperi]